MSIADHQRMVADRIRVEAYRQAIHARVKPGDVVVDVGSGTGLLAVFAAEAGARRVYGIEWGSIQATAQQVARANGYGDVIEVLRGDAKQIALPEPADWVISELMGSFGLEEDMMAVLMEARRWLKPGGGFLPERLALHLSPVTAPGTDALLRFWESADLGIDLSPVARAACQDLQRADPTDLTLLAEPATWATIVPAQLAAPHARGTADFSVATAGICHGLAGWFTAELAPGVSLRNGPTDPPTHWGCAFLPLPASLPVAAGDALRVEVQAVSVAGRVMWTWRWEHRPLSGEAQAGTGGSDDAWLDLIPRTGPGGDRFELTADGQDTLSVLAACQDGGSEAGIVARLQALGGGWQDETVARRWVRRVLSRYGRPAPRRR
jgi:protein arginine N-methyltransferase 1